MKVVIPVFVLVFYLIALPRNIEAKHFFSLIESTETSASIFKVYVWNTEKPSRPLEGTAFLIHVSGNQENPTLYFLTAAHVLLGSGATDSTKLDIVEKVELHFGSVKTWEIDKKTIRIAQNWESRGLDFALFKVIGAGKKFSPLLITTVNPSNKRFKAIGYPSEFTTSLPIEGTILGEVGEHTNEPWMLVEAPFSHGMSGGPVLSEDGVFAMVEGGYGEAKPELKCIIPLTLALDFIQQATGLPYTKPLSASKPVSTEITFWEKNKDSVDPEDFKNYLDKYPDGQFVALAKSKFSAAAEQLLRRADTLYNQQQWKEAEGLYRRAESLGVAPEKAQFYTNFGIALYQQNKWGDAEIKFHKAAQLEPNQANWYYNLGLSQLQQKKWIEYEATQRRLIELEPNNAGKHGELGVALYNQGKLSEAAPSLREAIRLDPSNSVYQDLLKKIIERQSVPPVKPVKPELLEYSIDSADDKVEIYLNGVKIGESSASTGWVKIPFTTLKTGANLLEIKVYNKDSYTGGFEIFGGHQREGWNYDVKFRSNDKSWQFKNEERVPPPERHGVTFTVENKNIFVDEKTGKISIQ